MPWTDLQKQQFGIGAAGSAATLGMNLIGNTISGLINNAFYRRNLNLQVQAQKDLMDYQNAYNSPSAQMQRLEEAGLNPNLVYGSQAPAGVSGSGAGLAAGANPGASFNTPDVTAAALHMAQLEAVDADAELKRANAEYLRTQNEWYPEITSTHIQQAQVSMSEAASRIELNQSTIQYQAAQKALAEADEKFRKGQISLQTYQKDVLIAQARLYQSDSVLKDEQKKLIPDQINSLRINNALMALEFRYNQIMRSTVLAEEEKKTRIQQLKTQFAKDAAQYGIVGSKAVAWTNQAMQWLGGAVSVGASIATGFGAAGVGAKAFGMLNGPAPRPVGFY